MPCTRSIRTTPPSATGSSLTDELAGVGITASENRVWHLCSTAGVIVAHHRRKGKAGKPGPLVHDDLLAVVDDKGRVTHAFVAASPNQVWLTDITEHPTREGKLYLCAIKDCYSNKIVGYSIDSRMKSALAASAVRNAIALRFPAGTICHSDRGSQFRSKKVMRIPKNNGLRGSMGLVASAGSRGRGCCGPPQLGASRRRLNWDNGAGIGRRNHLAARSRPCRRLLAIRQIGPRSI